MKVSILLEALTGQFETDMARATKNAEKNLKQFEKDAARAGKAIGVALVAAGTAVGYAVKQAINNADDLNKLAQKVGVSTEALSQLQHVAAKADVDLESLQSGFVKLSKSAVAAADGTGEQAEAFKALGVSVKNADGTLKGNEQLLTEVADAFSKYGDGAEKTAVSLAIFGKSGADLIPLLNQGAAGLAAGRKEAELFGLTVSGPAAQAAEDFNDHLSDISALTKGAAQQVAEHLLPTLNDLAETFVNDAEKSGLFKQAAEELVGVLKVLATAGIVIKNGFQDVGNAIGAAAAALVGFEAAKIRLMKGDLKGAKSALMEAFSPDSVRGVISDMAAQSEQDAKRLAQIWDNLPGHKNVPGDAGKNDPGKSRPTLHFDPGGAARAAQAGKDALAIANANSKVLIDQQKQADQQLLDILDDSYQRGLLSLADYYKQRTAIIQHGGDLEITEIQKELDETTALRDKAPNQHEHDSLEVKRIELAGKLQAAQQQQSDAYAAGLREQNKALEEQSHTLREIQIAGQEHADQAGARARIDDLQFQHSQMRISDQDYFHALADLEDENLQHQIDIQNKTLENFHGTQQQKEIAAAQSALNIEDLERDHAQAIVEIGREAESDRLKYSLQAAESIKDSMADNVASFLDGTKSIKDAFRDLANSILQDITRMLAKQWVEQMFGAGTGGGNILGSLLGLFGGVAGMGGAASAAGGVTSGTFGAAVPQVPQLIPGRAGGGSVVAGMPYWVGEKEPEMFVPRAAGDIVPMSKMGQQITIHQNLTVQAPGGRLPTQTDMQLRNSAAKGLRDGLRHNG